MPSFSDPGAGRTRWRCSALEVSSDLRISGQSAGRPAGSRRPSAGQPGGSSPAGSSPAGLSPVRRSARRLRRPFVSPPAGLSLVRRSARRFRCPFVSPPVGSSSVRRSACWLVARPVGQPAGVSPVRFPAGLSRVRRLSFVRFPAGSSSVRGAAGLSPVCRSARPPVGMLACRPFVCPPAGSSADEPPGVGCRCGVPVRWPACLPACLPGCLPPGCVLRAVCCRRSVCRPVAGWVVAGRVLFWWVAVSRVLRGGVVVAVFGVEGLVGVSRGLGVSSGSGFSGGGVGLVLFRSRRVCGRGGLAFVCWCFCPCCWCV